MQSAADHDDRVGSADSDAARRHEQQAIVTLSQSAITTPEELLLPQAASLVATVLGTVVVAIAEFGGDGRYFTLRSGAGAIAAQPGVSTTVAGTPIAALGRQQPVLVSGAGEPGHTILLQGISGVAVTSAVAVLVDGPAHAWGFILAGSHRAFAAPEIDFMRSAAEVLRLVAVRRQRERLALAEVQGRFGRIFQASPVALSITAADNGRFIDVNERWLSLFGYRRDEVIGRTSPELGILPDAVRSEIARRARVIGVVRDAEMQVRTKSGEGRDIIASSVPLSEASDTTWLTALVDITDRQRVEAERDDLLAREQEARSEAEQALEKLDAVYTITDGDLADGDLGELLDGVLNRLRRTMQVDFTSVLLLDDEGKSLYLRAFAGPPSAPRPPAGRMPLGAGLSARIFAEGRPLIADDYSKIDLTGVEGMTEEDIRRVVKSVMGAPCRIRGKIAGVVLATSSEPRQFTSEELKLLALAADRVALAIERGVLIAKIRTGLERQRTLSRRLFHAQEEERRRLAVELHDELGQVLTAVKINLETLTRTLGVLAPSAMSRMINTVDEALQRVRDIALDLRPSVLDDLGLPAAMRWYVDRFARAGRLEAHLSIGVLPPLDPGLQTACFRVAQEALTNVDRHAKARHVWIDLHVLGGALELGVRDDGIGFDVAAARGRAIHGASVGLLGMQERVALMGGEYEVVTVAAGGTEVRARFPLAALDQS